MSQLRGWIDQRVAQVPQWRDGWGRMEYGLLGSLRENPTLVRAMLHDLVGAKDVDPTTLGGASRLLGCVLADSMTGFQSSLWPGSLLPDDLQTPLGGILYFCLITCLPGGSTSGPVSLPSSPGLHWAGYGVWLGGE